MVVYNRGGWAKQLRKKSFIRLGKRRKTESRGHTLVTPKQKTFVVNASEQIPIETPRGSSNLNKAKVDEK
jgi:hypothetical protein